MIEPSDCGRNDRNKPVQSNELRIAWSSKFQILLISKDKMAL